VAPYCLRRHEGGGERILPCDAMLGCLLGDDGMDGGGGGWMYLWHDMCVCVWVAFHTVTKFCLAFTMFGVLFA